MAQILTKSAILWYAIPFLLFFAVSCYHWKRRRLYSLAGKIPGPPALPLIGSAYLFISYKDIVQNAIKVIAEYGPSFKLWMFNVLLVVVADPKHVQIILNSPSCLEKDKRYDFAQDYFGNGLVTAPVAIWRNTRKILNPTFNQKILNSFVDTFVRQSEILVEQLEKEIDKGVFNVDECLSRCALDTICETAMGTSVEAQTKPSKFLIATRRAAQIVVERAIRVWLHPGLIFRLSQRGREFKDSIEFATEYTGNLVKKRYDQFHSKAQQPSFDENNKLPFLEHLLAVGDKLTCLNLRNEVDVFITAGTDTVTTTVGYALVCLGMYPNLQEKVLEELEEVLGNSGRSVTHADLPNLVYLEKVIKETMRLYPPVPFIVRRVTEDVDLGDFVLPANSSTVVAILGTNRDPKIWPDPLRFDPERFSPEEASKRHPYSYIPFSAGPRNCIGLKYAMMVMKVMLTSVLRTYHIDTDIKPDQIRLSVEVVTKMIGGSNIRIKKR